MSEEPQKTEASSAPSARGMTKMGPLLAIVVVAAGIGLMFAARYYKSHNPPVPGLSGATAPGSEAAAPKQPEKTKSLVTIGGPFSLTDHNGQAVTDQTYAGQYLLVFFGYTFCPDVCPTTLTTLSNTMDILGEAAARVTPLFISVDPERDTPEQLKEYVSYFHPRIVALTGTDEQIKAVAKAYRVFYAKARENKEDPGDYLVDHSSITYLMGPDGTFIDHFSHGTEPEKIAERLLDLL